MILVTDAAGRIGSSVVRRIAADGHPTRALVPSRARATRLESTDTELFVGTLSDMRSVDRALIGVHTLVLLSSGSPEQIALQEQVIELSRAAGVERILNLSVAGAAEHIDWETARLHWRIEQYLLRSGIPSCVVRASRLMQSLELQVPVMLSAGILAGCQGSGRVADVDCRDVCEMLAALATRSGITILNDDLPGLTCLEGDDEAMFEAFDLTGPAAMTRQEETAMLSAHLGRQISYVDCAPGELLQCAHAAGMPAWQARDLVEFETVSRDGFLDRISPAFESILGRTPRDFASYAHEFAVSLRYSQPPTQREQPNVFRQGASVN